MFHSIVNPFIYYYQNKRIHEAINYILIYLPCLRSLTHIPLITMNFTEDNNISNTNTKCSKNITQENQVVNMIAYIPVLNNNKDIQKKSKTIEY